MTKKLYYEDAYLREFTGTVTACEPAKGGWSVTLDATAFYPEGGGQPADTGILGGAHVLDVHEKDGLIHHLTDGPLSVGAQATGIIDWQPRFSRMQQHTGEHMVSGMIHRLFGFDNVGFHMGRDAVTIDFNGCLTQEDLDHVERLANEGVWANLPVETAWPTPQALEALAYRSKKELTGAVRIVTVPGYDVCACCGTHLARTGETGVIKLVTHQRYKGGVRIWMLCGDMALADYTWKNAGINSLSEQLSTKPAEVPEAVRRLQSELESQKQQFAQLESSFFALKAARLPENTPLAVEFEESLTPAALRRYCLALSTRCGLAAVFVPDASVERGWKYAVGSEKQDVRGLGKELNAAFSGRGGGSAELIQGSLQGDREALAQYFSDRISGIFA